jgi:hypothetical protein
MRFEFLNGSIVLVMLNKYSVKREQGTGKRGNLKKEHKKTNMFFFA